MKSNKGMTIVSLIIYIIVLSIIIGTMSLLTRYFYKNENEAVIQNNASQQYSRLITYLTDDVNSEKVVKIEVNDLKTDMKLILIDNTVHEYLYNNGKIYFKVKIPNPSYPETTLEQKNIEICSDIEVCEFTCKGNNITTAIKLGELTFRNNFLVTTIQDTMQK